MDERIFVWDDEKQKINIKKHGITFEEAATVFDDANALVRDDPDHSQEERFVIVGFSESVRLLIVCHCYRSDDSVIRIISARKANRRERKEYGGHNYEKAL